jgi:UDP-N-acetylglucosamine 2-epimerase (non-hydrolysing)
MRVLHVVGARPNFMKAAPVYRALRGRAAQTLVHTGQHYDAAMSNVFFRELGLPKPDHHLGVGSGSHAAQTAKIMARLEPVLTRRKPDWVLVYGDVNSTVAAALVSVKLGLKTAHVEAGLRSRDRRMPEEHNRLVTDHLCDLLLTPSRDACANLRAEGILESRVRLVGNVMIDTLTRLLPAARRLDPLGLRGRPFILTTIHRPSNVDDPAILRRLIAALDAIGEEATVVFPVHPRTRDRLKGFRPRNIRVVAPLGYLDFLALQARARLVITDSGGIQEETTWLRVPCLTVRENTERPITVSLGTNELVGTDFSLLQRRALRILRGMTKKGRVPPLWDGHAGDRIAKVLCGWKA